MCEVLGVARSAFYAWVEDPTRARVEYRDKLVEQIEAIRAEPFMDSYGSPRMTNELHARGARVCENTVAKVMKEADLQAQIKPRFVPSTTDSDHDHPIAPNTLDRNFDATGPNQKWLTRRACPSHRHHVHPHRRRLAVSGGRARLLQP
jgi:putative transposase